MGNGRWILLLGLWFVMTARTAETQRALDDKERQAIGDLLKALVADDFAVREQAEKGLKALGERAVPILKVARTLGGSAEFVKRLNTILAPFDPGGVRWSVSGVSTCPIVQGERVWIKKGKRLHCLDAASGKSVWDIPHDCYSAPLVSGNRLFLARTQGNPQASCEFMALDTETGKMVWERQIEGGNINVASLAGAGKIVVMPLSYSKGYVTRVVCLNQADGTTVWEKPLPRELAQCDHSALTENTLLISSCKGPSHRTIHEPEDPKLTSNMHKLRAWNLDNGGALWEVKVEAEDRAMGCCPVSVDGSVAVVSGARGVYAYDVRTGKRLWESTPCLHVLLDKQHAYLLGPIDRCVSLLDGKHVWENTPISLDRWDLTSMPSLSNNRIFRVEREELRCLDATNGKIVFKTPVPQSSYCTHEVAVAGGRLFVLLHEDPAQYTLNCLNAGVPGTSEWPRVRGGSANAGASENEQPRVGVKEHIQNR